jgi:hypothetical protein
MAMIGVLWVSFVHILASAKVYTNLRSLRQGLFLRFSLRRISDLSSDFMWELWVHNRGLKNLV